jgi:hypothetical protein
MILDATLKPAPEFVGNFYRLTHLLSFDRSKRRDIANEILTRKRSGYSMGSTCQFYSCSICGENVNDNGGRCDHIDVSSIQARAKSMRILDGQLAFSIPTGIIGIECSSVKTPAAHFAKSTEILQSPADKIKCNPL